MRPSEVVLEACRGLAQHRLRASLSAAGIVFGIGTVVAALAVGEGARRQAYAEVSALGLDNLYVRTRSAAAGYAPEARFTEADLSTARRAAGAIATAGVRRVTGLLQHGSMAHPGTVAGVTAGWAEVMDLQMAEGRWLSEADIRERRRVMVLTPAAAVALLPAGARTGARLRWQDEWFTVVGVARPARRVEGPAMAYVPLPAADTSLAAHDELLNAQEMAIKVRGSSGIDKTAADVVRALERRGHPQASFEMVIPQALLRARLQAQQTFDWMSLGIGGLALLISGIGIMNIMLASVAERTAEIGVRRAAGATRFDVLAQFAVEAAVLCLAGGLLGVPLGMLLAVTIAAGAGWPIAVSGASVVSALALAVGVGLAFGIYPARRAARLDPVEALRA